MALELSPPPTGALQNGRVSVNGQLRLSTPVEPAVSSYLQYLPAPYHADPFVGRFLLIIESILGPIESTIDTLASYLDPRVAPPELLPWLASWVGVELDENWPLERRRQLIMWGATLYRWRGTRRGLREHLRLYTGRTPLIVESFDGTRIGQDAMLGVNTRIGNDAVVPHWISVTVFGDEPAELDERILRQIIEMQKPAHVGYSLEVRAAGGQV